MTPEERVIAALTDYATLAEVLGCDPLDELRRSQDAFWRRVASKVGPKHPALLVGYETLDRWCTFTSNAREAIDFEARRRANATDHDLVMHAVRLQALDDRAEQQKQQRQPPKYEA
jgi:hypothetical protein